MCHAQFAALSRQMTFHDRHDAFLRLVLVHEASELPCVAWYS